jgi:predicted dehydrogenase
VLILRALEAGIHVLCEKPLVTEVQDLQRVAAAAASAGRAVHVVHNWHKAPICLKISELIAQGAIGGTRSICWQTLRTQPAVAVSPEGGRSWRIDPKLAGGGILLDHGWHALYCVMHWGGSPRSVAARLENRRFHDWQVEDTATLALELMAGSADIHLTWAGTHRANSIAIEGDQGHIEVLGDRVGLTTQAGERHWSCPPSLSEGSHHQDWFFAVADDFRAAMRAGSRSNLEEAVMCARLIDLAQRSSAAGGVPLALGS